MVSYRYYLRVSLFTIGVFFWGGFPAGLAQGANTPVKDLEKALKSGTKQILFEGKVHEDLTIKKGVAVVGTSVSKAIIDGDITMENGSSLSQVTVQGKRTTLTIARGASVTLSNVTVRGGEDVGVFAPEGGGVLTIKNSRIIKNRKGLYVLPGKTLVLSGNSITENSEEGLDIRAQVSGTLTKNQFTGNGEGGAEIIAGGADLTLMGNTFSGNKASGLAIQSYTGKGKSPGSVILQGNTFSGNIDFGLTCNAPSGGGGGVRFFATALRARDNVFRTNKKGAINPGCGIRNVISQVSETPSAEASVTIIPQIDPFEMLQEKVGVLHEKEDTFEQALTDREKGNLLRKIFQPALNGADEKWFAEELETLRMLREEIAAIPDVSYDMDFVTLRQERVLTAFHRHEELRQLLERLTKTQIDWHFRSAYFLAFFLFP